MPKPNRLRDARFHRRLSQYELANQTDIPQSRISLIENALVEPREEEKQRLAAILRIPIQQLFPEHVETANTQELPHGQCTGQ